MKSLALLALPCVLALHIPQQLLGNFQNVLVHPVRETCPQAQRVSAPPDGLHSSLHFLNDEAFRARQADRLSRAVQVPTTVGDFPKDPYDETFEPVVHFQALLKSMFPLL